MYCFVIRSDPLSVTTTAIEVFATMLNVYFRLLEQFPWALEATLHCDFQNNPGVNK